MLWGILGGFFAGGVFGLFLACILFMRKDDDEK